MLYQIHQINGTIGWQHCVFFSAIFYTKLLQNTPYEFAEEMAKLIPQNVVVPFEKSGHAIFHNETEKLNQTMLKFIQKYFLT